MSPSQIRNCEFTWRRKGKINCFAPYFHEIQIFTTFKIFSAWNILHNFLIFSPFSRFTLQRPFSSRSDPFILTAPLASGSGTFTEKSTIKMSKQSFVSVQSMFQPVQPENPSPWRRSGHLYHRSSRNHPPPPSHQEGNEISGIKSKMSTSHDIFLLYTLEPL